MPLNTVISAISIVKFASNNQLLLHKLALLITEIPILSKL